VGGGEKGESTMYPLHVQSFLDVLPLCQTLVIHLVCAIVVIVLNMRERCLLTLSLVSHPYSDLSFPFSYTKN